MFRRSGLLLALITAAGVLAFGVATASAGRFNISNQGIRATWAAFRFNEGLATCPVTLEGTLHSRTIAKIARTLVGFITRAKIQTCSVGAARWLEELQGANNRLPWHIQYASFTGTLPTIETVRFQVIDLSFLVTKMLESCLYRSTAAAPALLDFFREAGGALTIARFSNTEVIPRVAGGLMCENTAKLTGSGAPTVLGSATKITLSLI